MNYMMKMTLLLLICAILFVGCSSDNGDTNSTETDKDDKSMEEKPEEDRLGLKLGETGIVENKNKIHSAKYEDEVGGIGPMQQTYIILDVTIKNIGDTTFDGSNIFTPSINTDNSEESIAYINNALEEKRDGVDLLDGELKPGDTKDGQLIFDAKKGKDYEVAFGHKSSQIVTKAAWEFSDSEIK